MRSTTPLRRNLTANATATVLASLLSLITAPLIFRWLGADAYGLVGVFLLLQSLMPLFDLGIPLGLARAVAWHRGSGTNGQVTTLVRFAERPMWLLALIFSVGMIALSRLFAGNWLSAESVSEDTIRMALVFMAVALAVRMLAGLQKAALMAIEHQVHASLVSSVAAFARTLGALAFALFSGSGVLGFFAAQIPVSLLEWWAYSHYLHKKLPVVRTPIAREELREHIRFTLGMAGLAAMWLLTSQVDKLALSRILPLAEFGAYALGTHIASIIIVATGPVQGAVLPRLTRLIAAGEETESRLLYGMATALTVALAAGLTVGVYLIGDAVTMLIEPDSALDVQPMQIAFAYGLGNCAIAIASLSYQLQNARGRLRLHAAGTAAQALVQIPILVLVASKAGALPTAFVFAGLNGLFVAIWVPIVHMRFLHGGNMTWLRRDLLPPVLASILVGGVLISSMTHEMHSIIQEVAFAVTGMALTAAAALLSHSDLRAYLRKLWIHP